MLQDDRTLKAVRFQAASALISARHLLLTSACAASLEVASKDAVVINGFAAPRLMPLNTELTSFGLLLGQS